MKDTTSYIATMNIFFVMDCAIKWQTSYSNNWGPVTKVGKRVLNVLEVDLSSLERAAAALEGWVLGTNSQFLGKVLRGADLIDTEKWKKSQSWWFEWNEN